MADVVITLFTDDSTMAVDSSSISELSIKASRTVKSMQTSYVSSITTNTPILEVCKKVRAIVVKKFPNNLPILEVNDQIISDSTDVAEVLADQYRDASSSSYYGPEFLQYKQASETPLDFSERNISSYNEPFKMSELEQAIDNTGNSAPYLK